MSLCVQKYEDETWRECVARVAGDRNMTQECLADFDRAVERGQEEHVAAWEALYERDCLQLFIPVEK